MRLLESQNLCKYLYYNNSEPLNNPDIDDTSSLLFKKIYTIPKLPDVSNEQGSYLVVMLDSVKLDNNLTVKEVIVKFHIIVHINQWVINGALRPYKIIHEIETLLNNQRITGIKKMQMDHVKFKKVNNDFFGYKLYYKIVNKNLSDDK